MADEFEQFNLDSPTIRQEIRQGLEEARRGEFVDGEEFFARWKARLEALADQESKKPGGQSMP